MNELADGLAIVHADDVAPSPWKNGGGVTRELLRVPPLQQATGSAADDWLLRISLADIAADGPFSPFDGVTRWFAVLSGHGVDLRWPLADGGVMRKLVTPRSEPVEFDGACAPDCRLIDGPTRDLNIMVRRTAARASLRAGYVDDGEEYLGYSTSFGVFVLEPLMLHGATRQPLALPARTLVWCGARTSETRAWGLEEPDEAASSSRDTPAAGDLRLRTPCAYWIRLISPA